MKVTMLEDREAALDGVNFVALEPGETYDVPEFLAKSYIKRELAVSASEDAEVADAEPVPDPDQPEPENDDEPAEKVADESGAGENESPSVPSEPGLEELMALTRPELDRLAKSAAVEAPDKLANKQAVAEAIIAARG